MTPQYFEIYTASAMASTFNRRNSGILPNYYQIILRGNRVCSTSPKTDLRPHWNPSNEFQRKRHRKQHRSAIWFHCTISSPETVRRPSNRADETGGNFRSPKHIEKKLAFSWLPRPSMADMVKIMFETIKSATIFLRRHIVSACTFKKHFNYMKTFYKLAVKI